MSSKLAIAAFIIFALPVQVLPQKLINGFTREFSISGLPTTPVLKSFDINGDSVSEFFVIKGSRFLVYDGKTFNLLFQDSTAPGTANLSPADVDRDGTTDLVASSSDTAVVIWYGPDFLARSVFRVAAGFTSFSARNIPGQGVEFAFGYEYDRCWAIVCIGGDDQECDLDGYVLRYKDTTFVFVDSTYLATGLSRINAFELSGNGNQQFLLIGRNTHLRPCMPSGFSDTVIIQSYDVSISNVAKAGVSVFPWSPCIPPVLSADAVGNLDSDTGKEFVWFVQKNGTFACPSFWRLEVYDIFSGSKQWGRTDSLNILGLFAIDLNNNGADELLSYELLNSTPALVEYQTADGATLGFTELPFAPTTLTAGLLGEPVEPRLLLSHGDSLVVYRINVPTGIREVKGNVPLPRQAEIYPSVPNPFNSRTVISYSLPQSGNVEVQIVDILGRQVRKLVSAYQKAGRYQVDWDAADERGQPVGSGVYLSVLKTGESTSAQKIVLLK